MDGGDAFLLHEIGSFLMSAGDFIESSSIIILYRCLGLPLYYQQTNIPIFLNGITKND